MQRLTNVCFLLSFPFVFIFFFYLYAEVIYLECKVYLTILFVVSFFLFYLHFVISSLLPRQGDS